MKLQDVLEKTTQHFKQKGITSARLDAEMILGKVLNLERVQLYINFDKPLSENELASARGLVKRRAEGEPIAYILGYRDFFKSRFFAGPGVLIPRPETELLVEKVLDWSKQNKTEKIIDLGTGSGCILLSLLKELSSATGVGVEASSNAAKYFIRNVEALNIGLRAQLLEQPVESVLDVNKNFESSFDVVTANPPYISENDLEVEAMVKKHEPAQALFSGDSGLDAIRSWSKHAAKLLRSNGLCIFEIGASQGDQVNEIFEQNSLFHEIMILKDYSGLDRFVLAIRT